MCRMLTVAHYEYKILLKRIAPWGVLLAVTTIALADNLPTAANLSRLEFLSQPAYFICRTMRQNGLLMAFGLLFPLSGSFAMDDKTGVKALFLAGPVDRAQYVFGKLLGGFLCLFTLLSIFLILNLSVYYVAAPFQIAVVDCTRPLLKTILVLVLPVSIFVGFCSVALPAVMNIRLFYLLISVLFVLDAAAIGSAKAMPFYLITSGDLSRLIWVNPNWTEIDAGSVRANLLFLVGGGFISCLLPFLSRRLWREN